MALGKVHNVDVVADGGAVAGGVVVAENEELVTVTCGNLAEEREQVVWNALGVLAHDTSGVSAAGVEIAQESAVPLLIRLAGLLKSVALSVDLVGDDILDDGFGASVGVGRANRAVLRDRNHVLEPRGIAVDSSAGREDDVGDVVLLHGTHERDGAADVYAVVFERDLTRLTNGLEGGEVDDRVNGWVLLEDLVESGLVSDVELVEVGAAAADELDTVESDLGRVVERVDNDNVVTVLEEGEGGEGANVAGATTEVSGGSIS